MPVIVKEFLKRPVQAVFSYLETLYCKYSKPVVYDIKSVKISAGKYVFAASASKLKFDGFMSVYVEADFEKEEDGISSGIDESTELKF